MKCEICGKEFENNIALGIHISKTHKITIKEYYDKFLIKPGEGICPVCGKETNFMTLTDGYHKFDSLRCRSIKQNIKNRIKLKYNTNSHTNRILTSISKNEKTKLKYNKLVKQYGYIVNYITQNFIYHCNKCNKDYKLSYGLLTHRLKYKMNPCPTCQKSLLSFTGSSSQEKEVFDFIKRNCSYSIIQHYTKNLRKKEIDIFIPELKIGFEYNGTYWHMDNRYYKSTDINKVKNKSANFLWYKEDEKIKFCEKLGIKLYIIKEIEWLYDNENQKSRILNILKNEKDKYGKNNF